MAISIDSSYQSMLETFRKQGASSSTEAKAASLESKLSGDLAKATDDELMEVCKSFESYLVEQVLKSTKKALAPSEEDDNAYLSLFSDQLYGEYAKQITENGELSLARQLYEAMKKDFNAKM